MTRLVVISAGLSLPSSSRLLADRLAAAAAESIGEVELEIVELRTLAHPLIDHLLAGFASGELASAIESVRRADGLIVVTPVFAASYSGLFKTFFDVLDAEILDGKPVLIAATAGTARHSLVLEHALRPLFSHLHAVVVPTGVFAASEDFGDTHQGALAARIDRAAGELAALVGKVDPTARRRRTTADGFADPVPFEELLREASVPVGPVQDRASGGLEGQVERDHRR